MAKRVGHGRACEDMTWHEAWFDSDQEPAQPPVQRPIRVVPPEPPPISPRLDDWYERTIARRKQNHTPGALVKVARQQSGKKVKGLAQMPSRRNRVFARDAGLCRYCGKPGDTLDHVLPKSRGGANSSKNLVTACFECNNRKADRTPAEAGMPLLPRPKFNPCSGGHPGTSWEEDGVTICRRCGCDLDMDPCGCGTNGHEVLAWSFCPNRFYLTRVAEDDTVEP